MGEQLLSVCSCCRGSAGTAPEAWSPYGGVENDQICGTLLSIAENRDSASPVIGS